MEIVPTMETKQKLILVLGPGHSGTTMLDLILGCSPMVIGLGEALRSLGHAPRGGENIANSAWGYLHGLSTGDRICTCGKPVAECAVWSDGAHLVQPGTLSENFARLAARAQAVEPEAIYLLDSTPGAARHLDSLRDFDLRAIHLVRDVRSWSASEVRKRGIRHFRAFRRWRSSAYRIRRELSARGIPSFTLGYEELALAPDRVLPKLCDWLGIAYTDHMLAPAAHTRSHAISGNRILRDRSKFAGIRYDGAWLARSGNRLERALCYLMVARMNQDLVYGNGVLQRP